MRSGVSISPIESASCSWIRAAPGMKYSSPPPPTRLDASTTESSCVSATPAARRSVRNDEHGPDGASACDRAAWSRLNRYLARSLATSPRLTSVGRTSDSCPSSSSTPAFAGPDRDGVGNGEMSVMSLTMPTAFSNALRAPGPRPIDGFDDTAGLYACGRAERPTAEQVSSDVHLMFARRSVQGPAGQRAQVLR